MMTAQSDSELCALLVADTAEREAAFAELYRRYATRIYRYARRICNYEDHAEDIVQETFLRFLQAITKHSEFENVGAYLLRIARNLSINYQVAKKPTVPIDEMHLVFEPIPMEAEETSQVITMSLELLPQDQREALVLQVYGGLSYHEIADILDVPMTTVRNWIVRGKSKMRVMLTRYLESPI
ncbi:MAG TPA: RNA polymerase sigma factor [Candidatus Kapabacteria bacterium]|nr:RNA polymerase sigma factor [Candidatus Kapabacteria bacterium]